MVIDTEKARERLLEGGMTQSQVAAQLDVLRMFEEGAKARLATKEDINDLEMAVKELKMTVEKDVNDLRRETKDDIKNLKIAVNDDIKNLKIAMHRVALAAIGIILAGMWGLLELYL